MRIIRLKGGTLWIAAANDEQVERVIISGGTWKAVYEKETQVPKLYVCDPDRAVGCSKTGCFRSGGECRLTTKKEWSCVTSD